MAFATPIPTPVAIEETPASTAAPTGNGCAPAEEIAAREHFVYRLLVAGFSSTEIQEIASKRFNLSRRHIRRYIHAARKRACHAVTMTPDEMVASLVELNLGIVRNPDTPGTAKVKALSEIAKLTGSYKPSKKAVAKINGHSMRDMLAIVETGRRIPVVGAADVQDMLAKATADARGAGAPSTTVVADK